jgi:hypothetical protein
LFDGFDRLELIIFHLFVEYGIEMTDFIECIVYIKEKMENKTFIQFQIYFLCLFFQSGAPLFSYSLFFGIFKILANISEYLGIKAIDYWSL